MLKGKDQTIRLILIIAAVVAIFLLSAGISQVKLAAGIPFRDVLMFLIDEIFAGFFTRPGFVPGGTEGDVLVQIVRLLFFMALVSFPIAVILVIISPDLRKRVLRALIQLAFITLLFSLIVQSRQEFELEYEGQPIERQEAPSQVEIKEIAESFESEVSNVAVWTVSLVLGLVIAALAIYIVTRFRRDRIDKAPLESLADRAENAAQDLQQGGDFRDTIIRCYVDMNRIVKKHRGIRREEALTAREFTDYLERAGLPRLPVQSLTQLFEAVRYGDKSYTSQEAKEAVRALQAVASACRNPT